MSYGDDYEVERAYIKHIYRGIFNDYLRDWKELKNTDEHDTYRRHRDIFRDEKRAWRDENWNDISGMTDQNRRDKALQWYEDDMYGLDKRMRPFKT